MEIGSIFARLGVLGGREFEQGLSKAETQFRKVGASMLKFGAVTAPLGLIAKEAVAAFQVQENALRQVEQGLKSTGNAVGLTFQQLQDEAAKLQGISIFGDEEILKGVTAQLLTFTNIAGDAFTRTQKAALDLSARLGTDLQSSAIQLGKALNDPVANLSALSRSGIQFSEAQKQVINGLVESGRLAEAQSVILDELEKQYGGSAAAAAGTFAGRLQQVKNAWGDVMEGMGAGVAQVLTPVVGALRSLVTWFGNLSEGAKRWIGIGLTLTAGIGALSAAIGGFLLVASPVAGIVAALAALGAGVYLLVKNWDTLVARTHAAMSAFNAAVNRGMAGAIDAFANFTVNLIGIGTAIGTVIPGFGGMASALSGMVEPLGRASEKLRDIATQADQAAAAALEAAPPWQGFGGVIDKVKNAAGSLAPALGNTAGAVASVGDNAGAAATQVERMSQALSGLFMIQGQFSKADFAPKRKLAGFESPGLDRPELRTTGEVLPDPSYIDRIIDGASQARVMMIELGLEMQRQFTAGLATASEAIGTAFGEMVVGIKSARDALAAMGQALKRLVVDMIAAIAKALIMRAILGALGLGTGGIGAIATVGLAQRLPMPQFATGGIVTKPTIGMIGEKGPEAVIPLNQMRPSAPAVQPVLKVGIGELWVELDRYGREQGLAMGTR